MRKIILQHSDHDIVDGTTWHFDEEACLLTPHIVLGLHHDAFTFNIFDKAITDETLVKRADSELITLHVSNVLIDEIKLEEVARMSIVEFAKALAKAPKEN